MNRKACSELAEVTQRNAKAFSKGLIMLNLATFLLKLYAKPKNFYSKVRKTSIFAP
jgi:hypothetical protein